MSLWSRLGFSGNLYDVAPLQASPDGAALLVGRDRELRTLISQLRNQSLHPTLEGDNGVGKTSIVLVAGYRAMEARSHGETTQLLLPITTLMQIGSDPEEFDRRAILIIAQALLEYESYLELHGHDVGKLADLRRWMNEPMIKSAGGGLTAAGFGGNIERGAEANTSQGFQDSGLAEAVRTALRAAFPSTESGAFIAIIDNVELLGVSTEAKRVLERIRDTSLSLPGVKWVLCGAKGIVRAAVASQRLTGRVARPIEIQPVPDNAIEELIDARLRHFALTAEAKPPVNAKSFRHLYEISSRNLRDALKYAQDFSVWLEIEDELDRPAEDFAELLEVWLASEAVAINQDIRLQPRQWQLFDDLAAAGGTCAPGDFGAFGFASMQRMRSNFAELERVDLISAEIDESDHRRRTVTLTSKGWIVHYARSGFERRQSTEKVAEPHS
ncbi:hypothetical protein [Cellulomonas xiejunii]|uniref:hypothetical protein n=1 Tax=Cellulomonas xiejunii TaxID=2968083 RepID=UPI001D0E77BA|nr:hypothetical protein [Cellulomonas xiejunii]MCC2314992.1 hypothetical protein [Cellulomonas xiejunii]